MPAMVLCAGPWQEGVMSDSDPVQPPDGSSPSSSTRRGGGCLIAAGLLLGPVVGVMVGEVSAGLIVGGVIGIIAAVVLLLLDRRR